MDPMDHVEEPFTVQSDTLFYKQASSQDKNSYETLILRGHVSLTQGKIEHLSSDEEVKIVRTLLDKTKQLQTIESSGKTTLTYCEKDNGNIHSLTCYGQVLIDHRNFELTMKSPMNEQGMIPKGQRIFFKDALGEIYADKLTLTYLTTNHGITPLKLILEGNVHLLDRHTIFQNLGESSTILRYAIADIVEYTPATKEMHLLAKDSDTNIETDNHKHRVLFFDKINQIQISAKALNIQRDKMSNKESLQGAGDVRFHFVERELQQLEEQLEWISS